MPYKAPYSLNFWLAIFAAELMDDSPFNIAEHETTAASNKAILCHKKGDLLLTLKRRNTRHLKSSSAILPVINEVHSKSPLNDSIERFR